MQAFGLDMSRQMGRLASGRLRKHDYAQRLARGRSQALPYAPARFGSVVSTFPSEYIVHPDTLKEVKRVLAPGGQLVVAPLAWITGTSFIDRAARWLFRVTGEAPDWNDTWLQPFLAAGFVLDHEQFIEIRNSRVLVLIFKLSLK
jgi:ubiquinone/menaquinone biosynthesis C-methylase UbiE